MKDYIRAEQQSKNLARYHKTHPPESRVCACGCGKTFLVGYGHRKRNNCYLTRRHKERAHRRRQEATGQNRMAAHNRAERNRRLCNATAQQRGDACEDCMVTQPRLVWHHLRPETKRGEIGKAIYRYSEASLTTELAKCILVCDSCHALRHSVLAGRRDGVQQNFNGLLRAS